MGSNPIGLTNFINMLFEAVRSKIRFRVPNGVQKTCYEMLCPVHLSTGMRPGSIGATRTPLWPQSASGVRPRRDHHREGLGAGAPAVGWFPAEVQIGDPQLP